MEDTSHILIHARCWENKCDIQLVCVGIWMMIILLCIRHQVTLSSHLWDVAMEREKWDGPYVWHYIRPKWFCCTWLCNNCTCFLFIIHEMLAIITRYNSPWLTSACETSREPNAHISFCTSCWCVGSNWLFSTFVLLCFCSHTLTLMLLAPLK